MNRKAHRIYVRTMLPFTLTLGVCLMAALFAIAFLDTANDSRFRLIFPTVACFALAYFLNRASLSWIRISDDSKEIVSVPSWYSRKLLGERRVVGQIVRGSELLFCRRSAYGAFDGYYIVLRTPECHDQVLWNAESGIGRRRCERLAKEIRDLHHFDVHLVRQSVSDQGIQETNWTAETDRAAWRAFGLNVAPNLLPYLGVLARLITPAAWKIVFVGVCFWLMGISWYWYIYRRRPGPTPRLAIALSFWTFQFVTLYAVTVLVTNAVLHRQHTRM